MLAFNLIEPGGLCCTCKFVARRLDEVEEACGVRAPHDILLSAPCQLLPTELANRLEHGEARLMGGIVALQQTLADERLHDRQRIDRIYKGPSQCLCEAEG